MASFPVRCFFITFCSQSTELGAAVELLLQNRNVFGWCFTVPDLTGFKNISSVLCHHVNDPIQTE